ncbi:puromycin-sensitive aminopeptidase-like protein [Heterostelium album PN500]|uniref:Aminopeptidase n=1 Tax=Heterostelium pallidum (strain ATCC 26659 / Pp 5 / PN500) TaxID=670386 RepID=D3BQ49_HETP5|nr:puromycin-sensitive aminopeptidase-like protein [Heterostelium album PN500]EFA76269.1 puromycin-sensitive aminopeptidase-like protein [Heterostelium album PN500]|eukprot:XP_020428401.1 puromycin-sensitive aminopeptidase-like protein [Heterostelium album PN500]
MIQTNFLVEKNERLLLPDNVVPSKYVLHFTPNFENFTFSGTADIHLKVNRPTKTIVLHCIEVKVHSALFAGSNHANKIEYSEAEEVVVLHFENEITVVSDHQVLSITFEGIHNDKLVGFYKSSYKGVNGEDRHIVTTQFEPTDARRCFPCFDEPSLKAVFDISLTVQSEHTALSNMSEKAIHNNQDGTKTVHFIDTPLMSTYLVALVVGDLEYIEGRSKQGVLVRTYKVKGSQECAQFAQKVALDVLEYFTNYFGVPYPLSKLDQIAVPDFGFGAMENWGLIVYRENLMLTSSKTNTYCKQQIMSIIGHEIAHQWFGNLVTMEWWSQLWLNEGFASWCEYLVSEYLYPEWNRWMEFSQDFRGEAMALDALDNSHPIEVPVRSSSQIDEIFDNISYCKGSCVINMINDRLGDGFRLGLGRYIKKHSYQNTNTEDLWQSLSEETGINVKQWIDTFTKESGYPIISFKSTSTPGVYKLEQKKFSSPGKSHQNDPIWSCFIKVKTDNGLHEIVFDKKESTITIPNFNQNGWIKPNYEQKGYYRMNLDQSIIKSLEPLIRSLALPAPDRLGLLTDCFCLSKSRDAPLSVFLELLTNYTNDTEEAIWSFIIQRFDYLYNLMSGDDDVSQEKLSKVIVKLVKPVANRLGFVKKEGEPSGDTNLRDTVLTYLGRHGDAETIEKARQLFKEYLVDPASLDADVFKFVVKTVMFNGTAEVQSQLIEVFKRSKVSGEREIIMRSLGSINDATLIRVALEFSLSKDCRQQDTYMIWRGVPVKSISVVWQYYSQNFERIHGAVGSNPLYHLIVSSVFEVRFKSKEQHDQYQKFFNDHPIPNCDRSIKQDLETGLDNMEYYKSCKDDLLTWINKQQQ